MIRGWTFSVALVAMSFFVAVFVANQVKDQSRSVSELQRCVQASIHI